MNSLFVLICLATLAFASASFDYCELNCPDVGWNHIQCNKNESLGPNCKEGTEVYDFSDIESFRVLILDSHNNFRNKVAGGGLTGFPKATTMATMSWSREHAKNSYYSVKDCLYEKDFCHDIGKGKRSGQNIATFYFEQGAQIPALYELVKMAFKEWEDTCTLVPNPEEIIQSFPDPYPLPYSSCLLMAKQNNNQFGCSVGKTPDSSDGRMLWVLCNYEVDNEFGQETYNAGAVAASGCGSANSDYTTLCSLDQIY